MQSENSHLATFEIQSTTCRCIDELVTISKGEGAEVMIATHNQRSIERAVALMNELDVEANQIGVYFGQLLGMADHLTFILGRNGYRVRFLRHWLWLWRGPG